MTFIIIFTIIWIVGVNILSNHSKMARTRHENVIWAYEDMDAARCLWPRVKIAIEHQVRDGDLDLSIRDQRRVIAAVVNDLLEQEKAECQNWGAPKSLERLLQHFLKPTGNAEIEQTAPLPNMAPSGA